MINANLFEIINIFECSLFNIILYYLHIGTILYNIFFFFFFLRYNYSVFNVIFPFSYICAFGLFYIMHVFKNWHLKLFFLDPHT